MRSYLRLTRAHTVPLEAVPTLMGAALAAGTVWSIDVALWCVAGILYHLAGYGHNSVSDWKRGYDKNDPYKQHHPLNRGTISPDVAKSLVGWLLVITVIYAAALAYPDPQALSALALGVIFGVLYNTHGKVTELKFIYISIAHTSMFVAPYLALGGDPSWSPFMFGLIFVFLWVVFQISVSGELKDITQDESNLLKEFGV